MATRKNEDRVLTPSEASEYLSVSPDTLRFWRYEGRGPAYCRLGGKLIRYRKSALDAYLTASVVDEVPRPVRRRLR